MTIIYKYIIVFVVVLAIMFLLLLLNILPQTRLKRAKNLLEYVYVIKSISLEIDSKQPMSEIVNKYNNTQNYFEKRQEKGSRKRELR